MNAPTLLIGLGGTGSKIVERVARQASESERANIAFAVFDTDVNELEDIKRRSPYVKTIQTSTKQSVGEYLNRDTVSRDTWFPVNAILNGKTLTEGAGQVRSISRLALDTVIRAGKMEPLHEAIQSLYKVEEDKVDQALRVVIASSLAGGTGSGLILPVAMYVRNYLKTHFRLSANICRGFFILPEVFYEVIPGQAERNNLKANAYATLRELDAFLMKGDATLPERYQKSVSMMFPKAASEGYEEYDVRPYDFCFLFDAQNAEGGKLNSFDQYLDHAANCIYSMSIGPMNKRSNSSEDNTIRKLAKEAGRNRYAGAGAAMLVYPYEDLRQMVALTWAKQSVSKLWLKYDDLYKEMKKENEERAEDGVGVKEIDLSQFYVTQIEAQAEHDDPFAKAIIRSCKRYSNGVTEIARRWEEYVGAILSKIEADLEANGDELDTRNGDCMSKISSLAADWNDYIDVYETMKEYHLLSMNLAEETSPMIAYSMFKGSKDGSSDLEQSYQLETYLQNTDKKFLHPNAIRYMLIKIRTLLAMQKEAVDEEKAADKEFFDTFEEHTFDDPNTEDVVETVADLANRKSRKFSKKPNGSQEDVKSKYSMYVNKTKEYMQNYTKSVVLGVGITYIESMIKSFENFYQAFGVKVETLDSQIADIRKKFSISKGNTVRYICTSDKAMSQIMDKMVYTGSSISIDSELSKAIYTRVRDFATAKDKPIANRYFGETFDNGIMGYFRKAVEDHYGLLLDVDVISALEAEARYENDYSEVEDEAQAVDQYVRKVINDTRNLSCPFIESPLGEQREPIHSCAFNSDMKPERSDTSPRAELIRKELMNFGGSPDEDIDKYRIMFYQSFYGLRANDLSKYAPSAKSDTYNRPCGEYFGAYYDLISRIHPESAKSREISPHINRWWHIITKMPDLDEDNQKAQEYDIYKAFFWTVLDRYYRLDDEGSDSKVYKLKNIRLKMENDALIVSNGTPCDKLYELLDAIAIYPELVKKINDDVELSTTNDESEHTDLEQGEGTLLMALNNYELDEPGLGRNKVASHSIFDLPLLMKKSATPDIYYESDVIALLAVEIEEIKRYLTRICDVKELPIYAGKIIMDQFEKHLESLAIEAEIHKNIYRESLFDKCCDTIMNALLEMGLKKEANAVKYKAAELSK